jgi:hypothetical protein
MKTCELQGAELDYWVARAEGIEHPRALRAMAPGFVMVPYETEDEDGPITRYRAFMPSSEWMDGGPVMEKAAIGWRDRSASAHVGAHKGLSSVEGEPWEAWYCDGGEEGGNVEHNHVQTGRTPLVAAMRAFVSSKFGDTVPDEQEPA